MHDVLGQKLSISVEPNTQNRYIEYIKPFVLFIYNVCKKCGCCEEFGELTENRTDNKIISSVNEEQISGLKEFHEAVKMSSNSEALMEKFHLFVYKTMVMQKERIEAVASFASYSAAHIDSNGGGSRYKAASEWSQSIGAMLYFVRYCIIQELYGVGKAMWEV